MVTEAIQKWKEEKNKKIIDLTNGEFSISEYYGHDKAVVFYHKECDKTFSLTEHSFKTNIYCRACSGKNQKQRSIAEWRAIKGKEIKSMAGEDFELIEYNGSYEPITVLHKNCGEFKISWQSFKDGSYCRICKSGKPKRNTSSIIQDSFEKYNKMLEEENIGFKVLEYSGFNKKSKIQHLACGYINEINFNNFWASKKCLKCADLERAEKLEEEFLKRTEKDFIERDYSYLGGYANSASKIRIKCNKCEDSYEVNAANFYRRKVDCKCRNRTTGANQYSKGKDILSVRKENFKKVKNKFHELKLDKEFDIDWDVEYVNNKTKFSVKHIPCGRTFIRDISSVFKASCRFCSKRHHYSSEEYKEKIKSLTNNEYECLDDYQTNSYKLKHKHIKCGREWMCAPSKFVNTNVRCPTCTNYESKGERIIREFLQKNKIDYIEQYKIPDCKNIQSLPFDFAIFDNGSLQMLIEFDGKQHFQSINHFGGEKEFKKRKRNDNIKNNYCAEKGIELLRIPYFKMKEIDQILSDQIRLKYLVELDK